MEALQYHPRIAQCRCPEPLEIGKHTVRVNSCPACVRVALEWFGDQLTLFEEEEVVSVSAVLTSEGLQSAVRSIEVVCSDDLPF